MAGYDNPHADIVALQQADTIRPTQSTLTFANTDVRFFGGLGFPNANDQGWTIPTIETIPDTGGTQNVSLTTDDNVLGEIKDTIRFAHRGHQTNNPNEPPIIPAFAEKAIDANNWLNILNFGASYSGLVKVEKGTDGNKVNGVFTGMGFTSNNDPRTGGNIGRFGFFFFENGEFTQVQEDKISSVKITLDGLDGRPLVPKNAWFKIELKINPTPDGGVSFGETSLYVNDVFIFKSVLKSSNATVQDIISIDSSGSNYDVVYHVNDFGITIYHQSPDLLIETDSMTTNEIEIITTRGRRTHEITLPDTTLPDNKNGRAIGDSIHLVANNVGGEVVFNTQNHGNPQSLFNGSHHYHIKINKPKEIYLINLFDNANIYQVNDENGLYEFESLKTGMIAYGGMELHGDPLKVTFTERTMRFVDKIIGYSLIITRPAVDFEFTDGLDASDDLGVVHFYEDLHGNIFGSAKTDWSTPEQRRRYASLGNADVNETKDDFVQANNPLVSAFGFLDAFGDLLAIGGSVKGQGGYVSPHPTSCTDPQHTNPITCQAEKHTWTDNGTCSDSQYANEPDCTTGGEIWTPNFKCSDPTITSIVTCINTSVNTWLHTGLNISGYTAVSYGRNFENEERPHTPTSTDIIGADLHLGYRTSDISMLFGASVKNINPEHYQRLENTTLSIVPDGKFTIQRVYQYPGTTYNMVLYGSTLYDNLDQAILNASTERYNLHPSLVPACFLAYLIVRQGVYSLDDAITAKTASILNYDGRIHPSTISADASPALSLKAGGKLRSMKDQLVPNPRPDLPNIFTINFEQGHNSLYGCYWNSTGTCSDSQYNNDETGCLANNETWTPANVWTWNPNSKTLKNTSQQDMIVNIEAQLGRRSILNPVDLELFIDVSYDNGVTWNVDIEDSYATITSMNNQINESKVSALTYRVVSNAMIRIGMITSANISDVGIIAVGSGDPAPPNSISGRELPSCELVIT